MRPPPVGFRPPRDFDELAARAASLRARTLASLAAGVGLRVTDDALRTKGLAGQIVERALGAHAGSLALPDFPDLGVELKTIPVGEGGRPRESTFVSSIDLDTAADDEWHDSRVRAKLAHVLWVPVATPAGVALGERRVGEPFFWRPTAGQERVLRLDFEDLMGLIGAGRIEELSAHAGRWLQVRPKAANGRVRAVSFGAEGERIATVPRGFYLRTLLTGAILRDAASEP